MFTVVSTRFNEATYEENKEYRAKNNMGIFACIYCSPQPMSPKIVAESLVFVIEMNNTLNQVEGIGLIQNIPLKNMYNVYDMRNFNRYIFKGKYRINRDELLEKNEKIIGILDYILFKEKTHMKRGSGFTRVTEKLWKHRKCEEIDIPAQIRQVFLEKFSNKVENTLENEFL
jgi:hypothetical protein